MDLLLGKLSISLNFKIIFYKFSGRQSRVVEGRPAELSRAKYSIQIWIQDGGKFRLECSGFMVSASLAVSAQHCFVNKTTEDILVIAGDDSIYASKFY
jgi:hypothetical protein